MLFCSDIKICRNLRTFWKTYAKKVFYWVKTVFLGQEVHYYIAYFTELILKICDYAFDAKIVKMRLTKIFIAIFAPRRKAA